MEDTQQLKKNPELPPEAVALMQEYGITDVKIGDLYIESHHHHIIRISKFTWDKKRKPIDEYSLTIHFDRNENWAATKFSNYGSHNAAEFVRNFKSSRYSKLEEGKTVQQYMDEAKAIINGEASVEIYRDTSEVVNSETALIHRSSKQGLQALQQGLEEKRERAEIIKKFVGFEMEKKKRELDRIRDKLGLMVQDMERKIQKIMRVITTIELYLGINEELFQIQDGPSAPSDTTISFRQKVLYMDEEIGHWRDGGLDFTNIDWFDNWLLKPENLQQVFPEPKGVVVFRPRRNSKDYGGDNWMENASKNNANKMRTYILIRNGDKLFRVFTENIVILPRLFPLRSELQELMASVQKEIKEAEGWSNKDEKVMKSKDKVDDIMHQYKKRAILLQGLIDRSEVFHPLPAEKVNIFNLDELGNKVQFIYDDELSLPSGRKTFHDWWKDMDDKIGKGSRILMTGHYGTSWRHHDSDYADRFYLAKGGNGYGEGLKNVPDLPKEGIYVVEEFAASNAGQYRETEYREKLIELAAQTERKWKDEGEVKGRNWSYADKNTGSRKIYQIRYFDDPALTIMYKPDADVVDIWNDWEKTDRKVRARFRIEKEDGFLINFDQISLDDVNFYLKSRVDRPNYLDMMPILEKMKVYLEKEEAQEEDFIKFVAGRNEDKVEGSMERTREAVRWWKFKNQWKRSIKQDDTLALRMIEKRILSPNYSTFEKY